MTTREEHIKEYNELCEALRDIPEDEDDDDTLLLLHDVRVQLEALAASLNAEETITVTEGLVKVQLPPSSGGSQEGAVVVLYPPADKPQLAAPYELHYDGRAWYSCVITEVVPPASLKDRIQYKAWIIGYPVEETVFSESLRPFDPADIASQLRRGVACHAVRPNTGLFAPAVVERLTLDGTAIMIFPDDSKGGEGDKKQSGEVELPLSHVIAGHFYPTLRKKPQLTEEEKQARRLENARRKREKTEMEQQLKSDRIAQDASDWQAMHSDLLGGSRKRKR